MQSGLRLFACAAMVLTLTASATFAAEYNLRVDMTITQVRSQLLKDGWTPVRIDEKIGMDTIDNQKVDIIGNQEGAAKVIFEAGFFEVQWCSGTGHNGCIFNYQKSGQCLRIMTEGEYIAGVGEPGLVRWDSQCPD